MKNVVDKQRQNYETYGILWKIKGQTLCRMSSRCSKIPCCL